MCIKLKLLIFILYFIIINICVDSIQMSVNKEFCNYCADFKGKLCFTKIAE